ncbi:MAG TPA: HD-GYP domain-containing protein [Bacillota bacterium]|nr:HD-GYP domain-containing protein [Bacillota bacterium]
MKKIDNSALVPGIILARDVFDLNSGLLIISAGTTLTPELISRLERFDSIDIYVKEFSATVQEEHEKRLADKIAADHGRVIDRAKTLMSRNQEKAPDVNLLQNMVGDIQSQIELNSNVLLNLSHIKVFDDYLFTHVVNVAMLALIIGQQLKLDEVELKDLGLAALLHDFGMTKLEYSIYDHNRQLTAAEWEEVKRHPDYSVEMLQKSGNFSEKVLAGIKDHHERLDGSGYPSKKKAAEIGYFAKIIAVADVYDACISRRKYRKPLTPRRALKNLLGQSHLFDLDILRAFIAAMAIYPIGSIVRLNTGEIAKVVGCHRNEPFRPDIRVLLDAQRKRLSAPYRLNLTEEANLRIYIEETLEEEALIPIMELLEE